MDPYSSAILLLNSTHPSVSTSIKNRINQYQYPSGMDEKSVTGRLHGRRSPLPWHQKKQDSSSSTTSSTSRPRSRLATYITASIFSFLIITYGLPIQLPSFYRGSSAINRTPSNNAKSNQTHLVPLEAHVMSKCPDAKTCLEKLVVPAMEQVVDMVTFRLSYIGSIDQDDTLRTYQSDVKSWLLRRVSESAEFSLYKKQS